MQGFSYPLPWPPRRRTHNIQNENKLLFSRPNAPRHTLPCHRDSERKRYGRGSQPVVRWGSAGHGSFPQDTSIAHTLNTSLLRGVTGHNPSRQGTWLVSCSFTLFLHGLLSFSWFTRNSELVENADKAMSILGNYSDPFDLGSPISVT